MARIALGLLVTSAALVLLAGCCGPEGPAYDEVLSGTVIRDSFVVPAGARVGFAGDVTIQCDTCEIGGDAGPAPAGGGSVRILATGPILVTGSLRAANGGPGEAGSDLELSSESGDITLGSVAILSARAASPVVAAGDGGNGSTSTLGQAGGAGGSVLVSCPSGTLTLHQAPGLLHIGEGGDGGDAVIGGAQLAGFALPEVFPNAGGNGGRLLIEAGDVVGVDLEEGATESGSPCQEGWLAEGVADGGSGGDAGEVHYGSDPETGDSTWPVSVAATVRAEGEVVGGRGGDGFPVAGRGGNAHAVGGAPGSGASAQAQGGQGGNVTLDNASRWDQWRVLFGAQMVAGRGGDAGAIGANGADGGPGQPGGPGGAASAVAGRGGDVLVVPAISGVTALPGLGGFAEAIAGDGGKGGDLCTPTPGKGGNGGAGGAASAQGGDSGSWRNGQPTPPVVAGGNAVALGGKGGAGGSGRPPGSGGAGGEAEAAGGEGLPPGGEVAEPGTPGAAGTLCPVTPPTGLVFQGSYQPATDVLQGATDYKIVSSNGAVDFNRSTGRAASLFAVVRQASGTVEFVLIFDPHSPGGAQEVYSLSGDYAYVDGELTSSLADTGGTNTATLDLTVTSSEPLDGGAALATGLEGTMGFTQGGSTYTGPLTLTRFAEQ